MLYKLLVNGPDGAQVFREIEVSGSYFDPAAVLWDERLDGPMPEVQLGGLVRVMTMQEAPVTDAEGNPVLDEQGDPVTEAREVPQLQVDAPALAFAQAAALQVAKDAAWEQIKARRDYLSMTGGYPVDVGGGVTKWFHSDTKSQVQQIGLRMMGAGVPPVQWKTMDGSKTPMSADLAASIFVAAATQDMAIFAAAEAHREAMEAAADPLAYDFSQDWPEVFAA